MSRKDALSLEEIENLDIEDIIQNFDLEYDSEQSVIDESENESDEEVGTYLL